MDFGLLFRRCAKSNLVKPLHALLLASARFRSVFFAVKLLNAYANIADVGSARQVFDRIPDRNIVAWNSMMSSYLKNGMVGEVMDCYRGLLVRSSARPDFFTYPVVLKSCAGLSEGRRVHCHVVKLGFHNGVFVGASLLHLYSKVGAVDDARRVFDGMRVRDTGLWNAMISAYCQNGRAAEAVVVFEDMYWNGERMDSVTVSSVLPICAPLNKLSMGKLMHMYVVKCGLDADLFVSNALISMYSKLERTREARLIFDGMEIRDLVTWNSMIAAYEQNSHPSTALGFFRGMTSSGLRPDVLTAVSLLSVAAQLGDTKIGQSVHGFVMRRGWFWDDIFLGNALIDVYAKLGRLDNAKNLFDEMPAKDIVTWNTLITGFAQNGCAGEAIEVYHLMRKDDMFVEDQGTFVSILPAFSHIGALKQGKIIHGRSIRIGLQADVFVGTCLIDMYAKCGRLDEALGLFGEVPRSSSVPWNALISGHGIHGYGEKALQLFQHMQDEGVKPDHITFVSLLSACSHARLVEEGQCHFDSMSKRYGIEPQVKHYACMVDLLGRAGNLDTAYKLINNMPMQPDAGVWGALLGACRIYGNVELGALASSHLFEIDSENVGYYVLLSNIYAKVGHWEGVDSVRSLAKDRGLKKTPGWSSIEVWNKVHVFNTGNQSHPHSKDIYSELRILLIKMKSLGYVPDYSFVLQDVEEDEKDYILTSHSERLAIAFGNISAPSKSQIHIFKNLRVCGDCHTATKFISLITEREIIVRDSNRFHHFKNGICSCGDFW